ncbi:MAG: HAD-IIB family hydrolase [Desulfobacterium sp.]|nr:HAD-IIB family hydrolase [Desulfobacterium sp.]MBU4077015.1 HAD-IIB family hydrolase [Euryarchaeota archaeon]
MIKLIVCDIEGCLTPGKGKPLNLDALKAIRQYNRESKKQKQVPPITLCTGRSLPYVEAMMQAIEGYIPAISENGACLYYPAEDDYQLHPLITPQTKKQMAEAKNIIHEEIITNFKAKFEWGKDFVISINPPQNILINDFFKIVQDILERHSIDVNITHSASAIDITPKGIDKFTGLQFLLEKLQMGPEEIAGIGDTKGDFPVLKNVGFSAAPNNATNEVKQIVNYVSDYENGDGVVDIIKHCILLNQK